MIRRASSSAICSRTARVSWASCSPAKRSESPLYLSKGDAVIRRAGPASGSRLSAGEDSMSTWVQIARREANREVLGEAQAEHSLRQAALLNWTG
jgi:hypothetical protein